MASAAASSQHRCVFVGNIPYDATEEQLIQICEEVGPVVSFRLVLDRDTGKPKGYGFCEYKDEETALSARRNLQGYEINGRPLRVDFAENDKGSDRNREQGRGGPGLIPNNDAQRPLAGPPVLGDSSLHQPVGLPLASTAASVMAKALGGSQSMSLQNPSGLGNDPLTHYISKMSRHQLNEIMSEMKTLATQNKPLVRQLLQESPQLTKALFQAQIMMGLVSPQMLQMASERQTSSSVPQPSLNNNIVDQKPILPSYPGQMAPQKEAFGIHSRSPEVSNVLPNSMPLQQSTPPHHYIPVQPQLQYPLPPQHQGYPQGMMPGNSGVPSTSSIQHQPSGGISIQPRAPLHNFNPISQIQPPLLPHPRPVGGLNMGHPPHLSLQNTNLQPSLLPRPVTPQIGSSSHPGLLGLESHAKKAEPSNYANQNLTGPSRLGKNPSLGFGPVEQKGTADIPEVIDHPSKRPRLENGTSAQVVSNGAVGSLFASQPAIAAPVQQPEKQMPQLPPEVESALLQQVMSLTPEQLSSLPLDQQQQVLQLQQMLR